MKRLDTDAPTAVARIVASLLDNLLGDVVHRGLSLLESYARLEARDHRQILSGLIRRRLCGSERQWCPELIVFKEPEIFRRHADHDIALTIEHERTAQDVRRSAEATLPEAVTQDRHEVFTRLILFRQKRAAQGGFDSQSRKETGGDLARLNPFRLALIGQVETHAGGNRGAFKNISTIPVIEKPRRRDRSDQVQLRI